MSRGQSLKECLAGGRRLRRVSWYRRIVEQQIGRRLKSSEVVHHINGDCLDNRLDNLLAVTTQRAHMRIHHWHTRENHVASNLYPLAELIRCLGNDRVIWGTPAGIAAVFGEEAAPKILAGIEPHIQDPAGLGHEPAAGPACVVPGPVK